MSLKLSIIIPAYNEEKTISAVIESVAGLDFQRYGFSSAELVIVDDGSTDSTPSCVQTIIEKITSEYSAIECKFIRHKHNRGKGAAIRSALQVITGDVVAIQDADTEYQPGDILELSSMLVYKNADVIYGSRFLKKNPVIYSRYYLGNKLISSVISLLFLKKVSDAYTGRKIFKLDFLKKIKLESNGFEIEAELTAKIFRLCARYMEVPINYMPRTIEEGKKISWRDAVKGFFTALKYRFMKKEKFLISDKKPKVCILSARFYPHLGGTEKQALEVASRLRRDGYDIFVFTQRYSPQLSSEEYINGIKIIRSGGWPYNGFISSLIFIARAFVFLLLHLKEYDIIHVLLASSPALAAAYVSMIFKDKKVIVKLGGARRTGDIYTSRRTFWGRLKLWLLKKMLITFVCPSDEVKIEMLDAGFKSSNIHVIPNGVDIEKFTPPADDFEKKTLRQRLGISEDSVVLIYIGRFAKGKGIEILLETFCDKISKKYPNAFLVLVGDGELRDFIQMYSSRENKVFVTNSAIDNPRDYLAASDIFVLPSSGEGLSNSLLEAMSCGLAVVVSDIPPHRQIISDGENGLLAITDDKLSLENAIVRLIDNKDLRNSLGQAARQTVISRYNIEETLARYKTLYTSTHTIKDRFSFGKNWQKYSVLIDEQRIKQAEESLKKMLDIESLRGLTFLDIGCGSGLFSLAAIRLGAKSVHSFDYDLASVECTRALKEKFYPKIGNWIIEQGSVLDKDYLKKLGEYDIVYSWGVLHHTGALYEAMENVAPLVKSGGLLFIAIYNTQKILTQLWKIVKRKYVNGGIFTKKVLLGGYVTYCVLRWGISDIISRKNPFARWKNYRMNRGMNFLRDAEDWIGGYPFETATVNEVKSFFERKGFTLLKVVPSGGSGNNEFVFQRTM